MANTTGTLSALMQSYYDKRLLKRTESEIVYKQMGRVGMIPKGEGKTVTWSRYTNLSDATTPLTEGEDPTPTNLTAINVTATMSQYGNYTSVTDILSLTALDNVISSAVDIMAYNAAKTVDTVIRDVVTAGSNVLYASAATSRATIFTTDVMSVREVRRAVKQLKRNDAPTMENGDYVAIIHPDVAYDLQGDTAWQNAHQYVESGIKDIYNGEVGRLYGVRFMETTQSPILINSGSAGTEVYQSMFFGREAFGVSDLQSLKTIVDSPSKRSTLELYSDVGWKAAFATARLNENFMVRVESTSAV